MGQIESKYKLPLGKEYLISYCKQKYISEKETFPSSRNLIKLIDESSFDLISNSFFYKLKHLGYSIKQTKIQIKKNNLNKMIEQVIKTGFMCSDKTHYLKDLDITSTCYSVNLHTVKYFISKGDICICGIIIDPEFTKSVLSTETNESSDIILIIGYTENEFIILTNWCKEPINVPNEFIKFIKEINIVDIKSPEDKYIDNLSNEN